MALTGALAITANIIGGVTNRGLRGQVAELLGTDYTRGQLATEGRQSWPDGGILREYTAAA